MNKTIEALTDQQKQIAFKNVESKDLMQHLEDLEIICDITMIKIEFNKYKINY